MEQSAAAAVIRAYLLKSGSSQSAFARLVGVTQGMVWQWTQGLKVVGAERAKRIEEATGGALKRHQLRPDLFEAPQSEEAA